MNEFTISETLQGAGSCSPPYRLIETSTQSTAILSACTLGLSRPVMFYWMGAWQWTGRRPARNDLSSRSNRRAWMLPCLLTLSVF